MSKRRLVIIAAVILIFICIGISTGEQEERTSTPTRVAKKTVTLTPTITSTRTIVPSATSTRAPTESIATPVIPMGVATRVMSASTPIRTVTETPTMQPPATRATPINILVKTSTPLVPTVATNQCPSGCAFATPPTGCLIKGNINDGRKLYHVPGGRYYDRTEIDISKGERWFCTEADARANGWEVANQ